MNKFKEILSMIFNFLKFLYNCFKKPLENKLVMLFAISALGNLNIPIWQEIINHIIFIVFKEKNIFEPNFLYFSICMFFCLFFYYFKNKKIEKKTVIIQTTKKKIEKNNLKKDINKFNFENIDCLEMNHLNLYNNGKISNYKKIISDIENLTYKIDSYSENGTNEFVYAGFSHIPFSFSLGKILSNSKYRFSLVEYDDKKQKWIKLNGKGNVKVETEIKKYNSSANGYINIYFNLSTNINKKSIPSNCKNSIGEGVVFIKESFRNNMELCQSSELFIKDINLLMDKLHQEFPNNNKINIFYAGSNSLSFLIGHNINENLFPDINVYDYSKRNGYSWGLNIKDNKLKKI
jgi:hypothetical protein